MTTRIFQIIILMLVPSGWSDADKSSYQTRYGILFTNLTIFKGNSEVCYINGGALLDLYAGEIINYNSSISGGGIDIDYVRCSVKWRLSLRCGKWAEYVNDGGVFPSVLASANRGNGDKDASE